MNDGSTTFQVVMPRLGLTMIEATIKEWLKPEGAWVEEGEGLFVLEQEKATLEIESPASGRLHILMAEGQVAAILTPIAVLEGGKGGAQHVVEKAELPSTLPQRKDKADAAAPLVKTAGPGDMGVDLASITGSGSGGKVMRRDIEASAALPGRMETTAGLSALSGLRAIIAKRLSSSWMERPQVTLTTDAEATALVAFRQQAQAEWNLKLSYNTLLVKIAARALQEHPDLNAQLGADGIKRMADINIGLAVDTERGLMVPVLQHADRKSIFEIHDELQEITRRAIEGRSLPSELSGGTFTITNLGMYEIDAFTPIINPPECAILGVGRIISRPVGSNGQVVLKDMMALSLSFDHRLVDGAPAARFLQRNNTLNERLALLGVERS